MTTPAPAAGKLFSGAGEFMRAVGDPAQFLPGKLPEVAFIGRSNVGKSSLVNAVTNRKALARASKTPGRTQQIIFFDINQRLTLVDLPGYGHAKAPRAEQDQWNALVHHYLQTRAQLKCLYVLIDGRHGALAADLAMMQFLDRAAVSYQFVLTKIDLVNAAERDNRLRQTAALIERHPAARAPVLAVSAEKHIGMDALRETMAQWAEPVKAAKQKPAA